MARKNNNNNTTLFFVLLREREASPSEAPDINTFSTCHSDHIIFRARITLFFILNLDIIYY